ncbi:MAG: pseudouridine synthase [Opitutales bacterium]|jgi:23S rRNA-/tRNA-specific pseudouridylate synthase
MTGTLTAEELSRALPLGPGVRVVAAGPGALAALEKPAGILTHPNRDGAHHTALLKAPYDFERECFHWATSAPGAPDTLYLLNRLDSPTSGLVLAALSAEAAAAGRHAFLEGRVQKTYFALVLGHPRPAHGEWSDRLERERPGGQGVRVKARAQGGAGRTAVTRYTCVETRTGDDAVLTLLRLEPLTGRTHQLRVQCATHGHPMVGDATYGDFGYNRAFAKRTGCKRLFLHAAATRIPSLHFHAESALPEEFGAAVGVVKR